MGWSVLGDEPSSLPARWEAPPQSRGSFEILSSCILTLILCVWTAMHLNIPRLSKAKRNKDRSRKSADKIDDDGSSFNWKKVKWVLLGLLMPEFVTAMAFTQWLEQRALLKFANENYHPGLISGATDGWASDTDDIEMAGRYTSTNGDRQEGDPPRYASTDPHEETGRAGKGRMRWTTTHCWYALMGGFVVEGRGDETHKFPLPNGLQRVTLTTKGVRLLIRDHPEAFPPVRKSDIIDKSKSNGFAKAIVCLQAAWFCVGLIGRLIQRLPLTVLELNTAAHCVCTLLCYVFWWDKPLDIVEPTPLVLNNSELRKMVARMCTESSIGFHVRREKSVSDTSGFLRREKASFASRYMTFESDELTEDDFEIVYYQGGSVCLAVDKKTLGRPSRTIRTYNLRAVEEHRHFPESWPICSHNEVAKIRDFEPLLDLHRLADTSPNAAPQDLLEQDNLNKIGGYSSYWMTEYAWNWSNGETLAEFVNPLGISFLVACSIYAGLHATAWNGPFGSKAELYLWRMGVLSFVPFIPWIFWYLVVKHRNVWMFLSLLGLSVAAFLTGRTFLVVEAFVALPHAPDGVFVQPKWVAYFPHFS